MGTKDGAFYSEDGVLLATVDTFTSNVNWNNAKYSVLGDAQEHETANTWMARSDSIPAMQTQSCVMRSSSMHYSEQWFLVKEARLWQH